MRLDQLKSEFNRFLDNVTLTQEMVNCLIERIELSYNNIDEEGKKYRTIKIVYKYIDESL